MKYKDIDIDVNQETKEKLIRKRKERTTDILSVVLMLLMIGILLAIIPTIVTICSPSDEKYVTFVVTFIINSAVLLIGLSLLHFVARLQSKRRIKYLPLDKETMQNLNIHTIEDYCKFLNEFLFVTPFGKEVKDNLPFGDITEIPKEMLEEINSNFPVENGRIAWNDLYSAYYVLKEDCKSESWTSTCCQC